MWRIKLTDTNNSDAPFHYWLYTSMKKPKNCFSLHTLNSFHIFHEFSSLNRILKFHFPSTIHAALQNCWNGEFNFQYFSTFQSNLHFLFTNNSFNFLIIPLSVFHLFSHRHQCAMQSITTTGNSLYCWILFVFFLSLSAAGQQPLKCFSIDGCRENVSRRTKNTKARANKSFQQITGLFYFHPLRHYVYTCEQHCLRSPEA